MMLALVKQWFGGDAVPIYLGAIFSNSPSCASWYLAFGIYAEPFLLYERVCSGKLFDGAFEDIF